MAEYINPWHKSGRPEYGPRTYTTEAPPKEYRGFQLYQRIGQSVDVVKDGVCVTQRGGPRGGREAVDAFWDAPANWESERMAGYLAQHGKVTNG